VTILPNVNTKESVLPIRDKPYHTNKRNIQKVEGIKVLRNYAFTSSPWFPLKLHQGLKVITKQTWFLMPTQAACHINKVLQFPQILIITQWYASFCQNNNDSTRKVTPTHSHDHSYNRDICPTEQCFQCVQREDVSNGEMCPTG